MPLLSLPLLPPSSYFVDHLLKFIAMIVYEDGAFSDVEPIEETDFTLRVVNWNEEAITWAMVFDENMAIRAPCGRATALKCPEAA
jgi:hypothetical protein